MNEKLNNIIIKIHPWIVILWAFFLIVSSAGAFLLGGVLYKIAAVANLGFTVPAIVMWAKEWSKKENENYNKK